MNAIILHGTLGSPSGNWFQWLKTELEKRNINVWLPELPNANQPNLKEWADFIHKNTPFELDDQTIVIGHSSGAILALILAQQQSDKEATGQTSVTKFKAVVAVSVFHDNSLNWEPNSRLFDGINFDWQKIRKNTDKLLFVHSDNDPYVPLEQAKYVADNCQAELITIPGQGHFNLEQSPDYKTFPALLRLLTERDVV